MILDCPSCLARVIPKADQRCPACRAPIDPDKPPARFCELTIGPSQPLPECCAGCGGSPGLRRRLQATGRSGSATAGPIDAMPGSIKPAGLLAAGLGSLLAWLGRASSGPATMRIELPLCHACDDADQVALLHADFDRFELTLRVSVAFRDKLRSL